MCVLVWTHVINRFVKSERRTSRDNPKRCRGQMVAPYLMTALVAARAADRLMPIVGQKKKDSQLSLMLYP